jgi:hypothetical protein
MNFDRSPPQAAHLPDAGAATATRSFRHDYLPT